MSDNYLYAIAGLLHDIGKFGQRADVSYSKSLELDDQSKKMAEQICNWSQKGFYTHQHVIWTNSFLETHKSLFENANLYGEGEQNMFNLACYHHKPKSFEHAIITMADYWSSGIDRNSDRILESNRNYGKDKFRSTPLVSIFNELATNQNSSGIEKENYGYPLSKNSITESIFPILAKDINLKEDYRKLWLEFNEEVSKIKTTDPKNLIFSLCFLLKKYTWYIPASTMDYPNCSLFEHLKSTGAFAHCLSSFFAKNPQSYTYENGRRIELVKSAYPVLMVCGDISGIQSFIYNISNKSAMKGLKGRSFYVQLLSETLCDELLEACDASIVNQVYSAGGKFYVLLPNTDEVLQAINEYEKNIQQSLWDEFSGKITVNIGIVAFGMQVINKELMVVTPENENPIQVGELWKLLSEKTSQKKKVRYNNIIASKFDNMFRAFGEGGEVTVCSVTGEELAKSKAINLEKKFREQGDDNETPILVSASVNKQIEIGSQLYDAQYLIKLDSKSKKGFKVGLSTKWDFVEDTEHAHSVKQWVNIQFANYPELFPERTLETNVGLGFRFYGGIPMAEQGRRVATLEEICTTTNISSDGINGIDKLGVLRMDVDNLGQLFMKGFEKKGASFSKLTTLSALLEQYFSGYLNTIKNQEKFKNNINIVYSGGDDVFAVGRWDLLVEFAIETRTNFTKFVCGRNDITLSAGLAIVDAKFPIANAAEASGEAEMIAKNYCAAGVEKNAFTIFGIPVHWVNEMPFIEACKNDLVQWIEVDRYISKGLLMKFFDYYNVYLEKKPDWQWQAAYTIAKFAKEAKNEKQKQIYNHFKTLLFTNNYKNEFMGIRFEAFIVACRWAELILKQTKN
jgi:CRISPR-associated protein Csm1